MSTPIALFTAPIGRSVFIRSERNPPSFEDANKAAGEWFRELVPPPLAERALAWERRHPLDVVVVRRGELPGVDQLFPGKAGVEEVGALRRATHAVSVLGASDASGDGWLGVDAYARGVARAFDGVIVDHLTYALSPLDVRSAPLAELTPPELSATLSIPVKTNRWLFMTHGLGNLGIPEVWFEDVPGSQVATAVSAIQGIRSALIEQAAAHVRVTGLHGFAVGPIEVPAIGSLALANAPHPFLAVSGLVARATTRPEIPLGRCLSRLSSPRGQRASAG